ncbi:MAG: type I pullulanase [Treponema sp.]|jgi:pullulanase|nr:type I pullulanase [Treponema sp.]
MGKQRFFERKGRPALAALAALFAVAAFSCGGARTLTVHYYRYMADYEGWNLWVWPLGPRGEGRAFPFDTAHPDGAGFVSARVTLPEGTKPDERGIGMILRRSEGGNEWAEKDGQNDRWTTAKEVWLVQRDEAVYTERPAPGEPPIAFAVADSADTVTVTLLEACEDAGAFAVYDGERRLAGSAALVAGRGGAAAPAQLRISLAEPIRDPARCLMVRDERGAFAPARVTMRGVLDSFYYSGDDLGVTRSCAGYRFKVWAPTAAALSVLLYRTGGNGPGESAETPERHPMTRDSATGVWACAVDSELAGRFYLFEAVFDRGPAGRVSTLASDPYARAVSANGTRMAIINLDDTNPPNWDAQARPPFGAPQEAVIYELHVRDFSISLDSGMRHKGKFLAFTERGTRAPSGAATGLDHLERLGVTHVHLLPAFDFASINELAVDDPTSGEAKCNWGYDPMHFNVPEGSYATDPSAPAARIREFKQMVQALHGAGIRVVMDVVFNHTYRIEGGPFDALVPGYYYRSGADGAYTNGSGCGNEVASERPMVRKFIVDSCLYWAREYGIDGFRFDLMGILDTETVTLLTERLRAEVDQSLIVYGEPWGAGPTPLPDPLRAVKGAQRGRGFAVFNDHLRGVIKGGSDDESAGFVGGRPHEEGNLIRGLMGAVNDFTSAASETVNYVTAHDNLNLWDKLALSLSPPKERARLKDDPYAPLAGESDVLSNGIVRAALLADGIVLTAQGLAFFQAGDEFCRSKGGDPNSYASGDTVNMIRWENAARFAPVLEWHRGLIALRKAHPVFHMASRDAIEKNTRVLAEAQCLAALLLDGAAVGDSWPKVITVYNGADAERRLTLPEGRWIQVVDERRAGEAPLAEHRESLLVPARSMAVLHRASL